MNKDLFIDGKEYISASRASKQFGYAQDYIGSLVRNSKVPGKMIGRTWYVDVESLIKHKNSKSQKKNPPDLIYSEEKSHTASFTDALRLENVKTSLPLLKYEQDTRSRFPELSKIRHIKSSTNDKRRKSILTAGLIAVVVFLAILIRQPLHLSKNFSLTLPQNQVSLELWNMYQAGTSFLSLLSYKTSDILKLSSNIEKQEILATPFIAEAQSDTRGIVVTKDTADHTSLVSRIKASFSDNVDVSFDEEGDSGVITPRFHDGDDTENYAFVLVPIQQTK